MKNEELYNQIKTVLKKDPKILAAYVIGSTVTGRISRESDFDLVVVTRNRKVTNYDKVYELIKHIQFPKNLDLSVVDKSSSPIFLYQTVSKGKKIYEKQKSLVDNFEAFALHNYYDPAHIRNIYPSHLREKLSTHANR